MSGAEMALEGASYRPDLPHPFAQTVLPGCIPFACTLSWDAIGAQRI